MASYKALLAVILTALFGSTFCGCGGSTSNGNQGNTTTITVTFTGPTPTAVATQIGSATFTPASLSGSTLTFTLPDETTNFAVAYVCPTWTESPGPGVIDSFSDEYVIMASTSDATTYTRECIQSPVPNIPTMGTFTATLDSSAIPGSEGDTIFALQGDFSVGYGMGDNPIEQFSMQLPVGTDDIFVASSTFPSPISTQSTILALKAFPSQKVPGTLNGGNTVTLTAADETTPTAITYSNVPTGSSPVSSASFYPNGQTLPLPLSIGATSTYPALPSSLLAGDAKYGFTSIPTLNVTSPYNMNVMSYTNSNDPLSVNYPNSWICPTPIATTYPVISLSSYSGFEGLNGVGMQNRYLWNTTATSRYSIYVAAASDVIPASGLTVPDLSGAGRSFFAVPVSGTSAEWNSTISHYSSGKYLNIAINTYEQNVFCNGTYTVP
jgi:hypothetical protein